MDNLHIWFPMAWFFQAIFIGYYGLHLKVNGGISWVWAILLGPIAGIVYLYLATQKLKLDSKVSSAV